jgi:hypothetical protein
VDPDRYRRFHVESCSPNASRRRTESNPPRDSFSAASMVAALWRHGPNMLAQMQAKNSHGLGLSGPKWPT